MIYEKKAHQHQSDKSGNTGTHPVFPPAFIARTPQAFAAWCAELLQWGKALCCGPRRSSIYQLSQDGHALFVRPAGPDPIRKGDVIPLTHKNGRAVVPRLKPIQIDKAMWFYETRGDHPGQTDRYTVPNRVVGFITGIEHESRSIAVNHSACKSNSSGVGWYLRKSLGLDGFFRRLN